MSSGSNPSKEIHALIFAIDILSDDDFFAPLAVEAMLAVGTINPRGEKKFPVKAVNVLKAHGKSARESFMVKGYALNCTVASQGEQWNRLKRRNEDDLTIRYL